MIGIPSRVCQQKDFLPQGLTLHRAREQVRKNPPEHSVWKATNRATKREGQLFQAICWRSLVRGEDDKPAHEPK